MTERIKNIGPEGQRMRLRYGLIALGLGLVAGVVLVISGANRWWRLVLFIPFWQGGIGIFQALNKT